MKRALLIQRVRTIAKSAGMTVELVRQGGKHEVWRVGSRQVSVPRHGDINERTARSILDDVTAATKDK